jgi:hypothetical protein
MYEALESGMLELPWETCREAARLVRGRRVMPVHRSTARSMRKGFCLDKACLVNLAEACNKEGVPLPNKALPHILFEDALCVQHMEYLPPKGVCLELEDLTNPSVWEPSPRQTPGRDYFAEFVERYEAKGEGPNYDNYKDFMGM